MKQPRPIKSQRIRTRELAIQELRPLYDQATAITDLGTHPNPELYQKFADTCGRMGLPDEARAWHSLVLRHDPENQVSLTVLAQLGEEKTPR